jgi:hypothetical protein
LSELLAKTLEGGVKLNRKRTFRFLIKQTTFARFGFVNAGKTQAATPRRLWRDGGFPQRLLQPRVDGTVWLVCAERRVTFCSGLDQRER